MLNFINKILNYFGYVVRTTEDIESYELQIDTKDIQISELDTTAFKLHKEKDRLINLVADKDKDIQSLEHKVNNLQWLAEEDRLTIENLNKQTIRLEDKIAKLDLDINDITDLAKNRYKEVNALRSREKALRDSRDNYKHKYREVCWKIALKKCCQKRT